MRIWSKKKKKREREKIKNPPLNTTRFEFIFDVEKRFAAERHWWHDGKPRVNRAQQQQPYFKASAIDVSQKCCAAVCISILQMRTKENRCQSGRPAYLIIYSTHKTANNPYIEIICRCMAYTNITIYQQSRQSHMYPIQIGEFNRRSKSPPINPLHVEFHFWLKRWFAYFGGSISPSAVGINLSSAVWFMQRYSK